MATRQGVAVGHHGGGGADGGGDGSLSSGSPSRSTPLRRVEAGSGNHVSESYWRETRASVGVGDGGGGGAAAAAAAREPQLHSRGHHARAGYVPALNATSGDEEAVLPSRGSSGGGGGGGVDNGEEGNIALSTRRESTDGRGGQALPQRDGSDVAGAAEGDPDRDDASSVEEMLGGDDDEVCDCECVLVCARECLFWCVFSIFCNGHSTDVAHERRQTWSVRKQQRVACIHHSRARSQLASHAAISSCHSSDAPSRATPIATG
jgi:hypothetical protein